jgi:hypothetical protein
MNDTYTFFTLILIFWVMPLLMLWLITRKVK